MKILTNKAIAQLVNGMDQAIVIDLLKTEIARLQVAGYSQADVTKMVSVMLTKYNYTTAQGIAFVAACFAEPTSTTKYDGYGPDGYGITTGYVRMAVSANLNADSKVVRTMSVGANTIVGQAQNFDIPLKVTVTEI